MSATIPTLVTPSGEAIRAVPTLSVDQTGAYAAGGGGGGGGGGPATIVDGGDVAQGTTTDTLYTDKTGAAKGTVIGLLKTLYANLPGVGQKTMAASQPVTIASDQTAVPTSGTGANGSAVVGNPNLTAGADSGGTTRTIRTDANGGVVLAATTASGGPIAVGGNGASGTTDSGNPVKAGGIYNSTLPTFTTGQRGDLQIDNRGNLGVFVKGSNAVGADAFSNSALVNLGNTSDPASQSNLRLMADANFLYNGSTWDRQRGDATGGAWAQGAVADGGTDTGNPLKTGAVYSATIPTYTAGQRTTLQADQRGSVRMLIANGNSGLNANVTAGPTDAFATNAISALHSYSFNAIFNGASWDRVTAPNITSRLTASAAGGSPTSVKTTAGKLSSWFGQVGSTAIFLQIYDKASAPVLGTDTPRLTYPLPANAQFSRDIGNGGLHHVNGIAYAFTTDAAGTTGAAASAVTAFGLLAA